MGLWSGSSSEGSLFPPFECKFQWSSLTKLNSLAVGDALLLSNAKIVLPGCSTSSASSHPRHQWISLPLRELIWGCGSFRNRIASIVSSKWCVSPMLPPFFPLNIKMDVGDVEGILPAGFLPLGWFDNRHFPKIWLFVRGLWNAVLVEMGSLCQSWFPVMRCSYHGIWKQHQENRHLAWRSLI